MATLPAQFNIQEFTDDGRPLALGRVYTFLAGTDQFKAAYTDRAGSIPHTYTSDGLGGQYIALNTRGEIGQQFLLGPGAYDISLRRPDGSTVWTRRAYMAANADGTAPMFVEGTPNQIVVVTTIEETNTVATVSVSPTLVLPGTAEYAAGEPLGFMNIEQAAVSAAYTTALGDANRSKVHPAADTTARAWVLDNLAYRMGAAITFINEVGAGVITLTAASGNFLLAGTGTVTTITMAAASGCTVIRIPGTNRWFVSGAGITGA